MTDATATAAAATTNITDLLAQKSALDVQFAAIPPAELVNAALAILARPDVQQAVADLAPICQALPAGQAKIQTNNFVNIAKAVPTLLAQEAALLAPPPAPAKSA